MNMLIGVLVEGVSTVAKLEHEDLSTRTSHDHLCHATAFSRPIIEITI